MFTYSRLTNKVLDYGTSKSAQKRHCKKNSTNKSNMVARIFYATFKYTCTSTSTSRAYKYQYMKFVLKFQQSRPYKYPVL